MVQQPNASYKCKPPDSDTKAQKGALIEVERKEKFSPPTNYSFRICSGSPDSETYIV
jgi:hypothetical protein